MRRHEFSNKICVAAWKRADGHCEICTRPLYRGDARFDHRIPDGLTGAPTLENCQCICRWCHDKKTFGTDIPAIARAKRREAKHLGVKRSRRPMPGGRNDKLKKKISGEVVPR